MTETRTMLMTCKVGPKKHISREAKKGASCNVKEAQSLFSTYRTNTSLRLRNSISRLYQPSLHEASTIFHCYRSVKMQKQSKSLILYVRQWCWDACTHKTHTHTHTHTQAYFSYSKISEIGGVLCGGFFFCVYTSMQKSYRTTILERKKRSKNCHGKKKHKRS